MILLLRVVQTTPIVPGSSRRARLPSGWLTWWPLIHQSGTELELLMVYLSPLPCGPLSMSFEALGLGSTREYSER